MTIGHPQHPQVRIEHDGFSAEVDEGIADLLLNLWRLEFFTFNSCQDNFGKVWIEFADAINAGEFLSIAAGEFDEDIDSLYNRVVDGWQPDEEADYEDFRDNRAWLYKVMAHDLNVRIEVDEENHEISDTSVGPPAIYLSVSVRFPRSDLPEVERRILARLERADNAPGG